MEAARLITLTTDFGAASCFVGIMKGVIHSINPGARVVDLTHTVGFGNVREAAFILAKSYRFFPEDAIHVVVVDPGVGTDRRIVLLEKGRTLFLAPDNGVLSYLYEEGDNLFQVVDDTFFLKPVSKTFHGRDIFAPVAALLSLGLPVLSLAEKMEEMVLIPKPKVVQGRNWIEGEVVAVDSFGNIITSIQEEHLKRGTVAKITLGSRDVFGPVDSFEEGRGRGLCAIVDSFGHLEIFVYMGSAADLVGDTDASVRVEFC